MPLDKKSIDKRVAKMQARDKKKRKLHGDNIDNKPSQTIDPVKLTTAITDAVLDKMDYSRNQKSPINPNLEKIASRIVDTMDCPLLSKADWNCNKKEEGKELSHPFLHKGAEPQCINGNFMNCPAYRLYFSYRLSKRAPQRE